MSIPVEIPLQLTRPGAIAPSYRSAGAAGMDLHAAIDQPIQIAQGGRALVPCGVAIAIPNGFEGQVRPRSGLALKFGVTVLNAPGTIDSDYRGEIQVILVNQGDASFTVEPRDRVAQLVIAPVSAARFHIGVALDETGRGVGGFGHTGTRGD